MSRLHGLTLLELLVFMVIVGLLVAFIAPRDVGEAGKSAVDTAKARMDVLEKALDKYRLDTGHYPDAELGLKALVQRPTKEAKWKGPYLRKQVPLDPWGKAYVYRMPGETAEFELLSYGKDGRPGGSGQAADISNR